MTSGGLGVHEHERGKRRPEKAMRVTTKRKRRWELVSAVVVVGAMVMSAWLCLSLGVGAMEPEFRKGLEQTVFSSGETQKALAEVWPQPKLFKAGQKSVELVPEAFRFQFVRTQANSSEAVKEVIQAACGRYQKLIFGSRTNAGRFQLPEVEVFFKRLPREDETIAPPEGALEALEIRIQRDDLYEHGHGVDESYTLHIYASGRAELKAQTWVGALRGLETFSQLVLRVRFASSDLRKDSLFERLGRRKAEEKAEDDEDDEEDQEDRLLVTNVPLFIEDKPRFPWRGLLIDTARHFLPVPDILRTLDAMSYNKLNVLHWHITDSQSFPLRLDTVPELANRGAYSTAPTAAIYTSMDVREIVRYARYRGIRVVPELDIPGHSASWAASHPEVLADCTSVTRHISLDPTKESTYTLVERILKELATLFEDEYIHLGGDEVDFKCWKAVPSIREWMKEHNIMADDKGLKSLQGHFGQRVQQIAAQFGKKTALWQEHFDNGFKMLDDSVINVWLDHKTMQKVVDSGHGAILNYGYYLDVDVPGCSFRSKECLDVMQYFWRDTWKTFYRNDPADLDIPISSQAQKLILGGEASSWAESVDEFNIDSRIWSRTPAVAEKLWSTERFTSDLEDNQALVRMTRFVCKMQQRGIRAGPTQPGYCPRGPKEHQAEHDHDHEFQSIQQQRLSEAFTRREIMETLTDHRPFDFLFIFYGLSLGIFGTIFVQIGYRWYFAQLLSGGTPGAASRTSNRRPMV